MAYKNAIESGEEVAEGFREYEDEGAVNGDGRHRFAGQVHVLVRGDFGRFDLDTSSVDFIA